VEHGWPRCVRFQSVANEITKSHNGVGNHDGICPFICSPSFFRLKDRDELRTDAENKQKFELQKQQRELQTNLNIKRAMRKWVTLDKEARRQQQQQKKTSIVQIPEWAQ
jgi:hypothetical protein